MFKAVSNAIVDNYFSSLNYNIRIDWILEVPMFRSKIAHWNVDSITINT